MAHGALLLDTLTRPDRYVTAWRLTRAGQVAAVGADWAWPDRVGAAAVRLGLGRNRYLVPPGLYALGAPGPDSPVLATANFKLTFDVVRRDVRGLDAWLLVLDTRGVNVWCAAGKGTFSTAELIRRIQGTGLERLVSPRRLIVPQLGAPGVAGHEVRAATGFTVVFGPVRARDLPAFLQAGGKATPGMRRVDFPVRDRLAVSLVEWTRGLPSLGLVLVGLFLLAGFGSGVFSLERAWQGALAGWVACLLGFVAGNGLVPLLLPWLPGRAFGLKGAEAGAVAGLAGQALAGGWAMGLGLWLGAVAVGSWYGMHFTGASTFTSPSGVEREMRRAIPLQLAGGLLALILWRAGLG
jgi:hypothetical protein